MMATRPWYMVDLPEDLIHWDGCRFETHASRPVDLETFARSDVPEKVTCPFCVAILESRGPGSDTWRAEDRRRRAADRAYELEMRRAAKARALRLLEQDAARQVARVRRERQGELNQAAFREVRKLRAFRQRYERHETAESHDRATRLRDWEQGLDAWPDVHLWQACEAIHEFQSDRLEDPAHWTELR